MLLMLTLLINNQSKDKVTKQTKPKRRARSSYNVFTRECGEKKEELLGTPEDIKEKGGFLKCASKAWKALSEKEKQKYQDQADKDKERYERQFEQYEKKGKFDEEGEKKETKKGKKGENKKEEEQEEEVQDKKKNNNKKSNKRMCGS